MIYDLFTVRTARMLANRAALASLITASGTLAHATAYSDSFTADPRVFNCGYFGATELYGSFTFFGGSRTLVDGETLDELVNY